ncbi:MAG: hypothetical protein JSR58_06415 [Verrucomicrobia bacterium]|nr:hypothetical protein [Verrucomicrobiota bacterium]
MSSPLTLLPLELQKLIYGYLWEDLQPLSCVDKLRNQLANEIAQDVLKNLVPSFIGNSFPPDFPWDKYVSSLFFHVPPDKRGLSSIAQLKYVVHEIFLEIYRKDLWTTINIPQKTRAICQWMLRENVDFKSASFQQAFKAAYWHFSANPVFNIGNFTLNNPRPYQPPSSPPTLALTGTSQWLEAGRPSLNFAEFLHRVPIAIQQKQLSWKECMSTLMGTIPLMNVIYNQKELTPFQTSLCCKAFQRVFSLMLEETSFENTPMHSKELNAFRLLFRLEKISSLFLQRLKEIPSCNEILAHNSDILSIILSKPETTDTDAIDFIQLYWKRLQQTEEPSQPVLSFRLTYLDIALPDQCQRVSAFLRAYQAIGGDVNEQGVWLSLAKQTSHPVRYWNALKDLQKIFPINLEMTNKKGKTIPDILEKRKRRLLYDLSNAIHSSVFERQNSTLAEVRKQEQTIATAAQTLLEFLKEGFDPAFPIPTLDGNYQTASELDAETQIEVTSTLTTPLALVLSSPCLPHFFVEQLRAHPCIGKFLTPPNLLSPLLTLIANPTIPLDECTEYLKIFSEAGGQIDEASFIETYFHYFPAPHQGNSPPKFSSLHVRFSFFNGTHIDSKNWDQFLKLYCLIGGDLNNQSNRFSCTPLHVLATKMAPALLKKVLHLFVKHGADIALKDSDGRTIHDMNKQMDYRIDKAFPRAFWFD